MQDGRPLPRRARSRPAVVCVRVRRPLPQCLPAAGPAARPPDRTSHPRPDSSPGRQRPGSTAVRLGLTSSPAAGRDVRRPPDQGCRPPVRRQARRLPRWQPGSVRVRDPTFRSAPGGCAGAPAGRRVQQGRCAAPRERATEVGSGVSLRGVAGWPARSSPALRITPACTGCSILAHANTVHVHIHWQRLLPSSTEFACDARASVRCSLVDSSDSTAVLMIVLIERCTIASALSHRPQRLQRW